MQRCIGLEESLEFVQPTSLITCEEEETEARKGLIKGHTVCQRHG